MEMHSESMVVTIRDASTHKTLREFDHSRSGWESKSRVPIANGTEYEFVLKNLSFQRRRVDITIDGTVITPNSLIVPANAEVVLERFMDSDKRFKAVMQDNPAVQDPTSSENGKIIVQVWSEKFSSIDWTKLNGGGPFKHPDPYHPYTSPWASSHWYLSSGSGPHSTNEIYSNSAQWTSGIVNCSAVHNGDTEPMATIEGSKSEQQFISTEWTGDSYATPVVFQFTLTQSSAEPKTGYCTDCGVKLVEAAKFCQDCGHKVRH